MAYVAPASRFHHLTNVPLLRRAQPPMGLPPKQLWRTHSLALPDELWFALRELAERLSASGQKVGADELTARTLWGVFLATPRRVTRASFPPGDAGQASFEAYNRAKGRLGKQIVANSHIFPDGWRLYPGRAALEDNPQVGLAPANLPAGSGGVEFFALPPSPAGAPPSVGAVVLAVRTTTAATSTPEWGNVSEAGLATAHAAVRERVPALLIRVVLAEDPPVEILERDGMTQAVREALLVPLQYRLDYWQFTDVSCTFRPGSSTPSGQRRYVITMQDRGEAP